MIIMVDCLQVSPSSSLECIYGIVLGFETNYDIIIAK